MPSKPIPVINRQLRRHAFTIQPNHIFPRDQTILWSIEELNVHFTNWFENFKLIEQPTYLKYLAMSLELTPEIDKNGQQNMNWGKLHINGCVFWKKPVRWSQQQNALGIPSAHVMVVQNPHAIIDYCTASGQHVNKEHIEIFEICPTGNRPHAGARSRQALTDTMIQYVQAGYSVGQIWRHNPRVVAHFGTRRLQDFIDLQKYCNKESDEVNRADRDGPLLPRHPSRVSRKPSVSGFLRDTVSAASRSRDEEE